MTNYLDLDGLRYHYLDEGTGEPVVMVHGNPTWSFYFRNLVHGLREDHRLIVPDHIGCGLSDKPDDSRYPYTLQRRADDLDRLLDSLELRDNITLVLHDWGGMIGMTYAVRHPERIKRIVLLNTAAFLLPEKKRLPWSIWFARLPGLGAVLVRGFNGFCRGAVRYCSVKGLSADSREGYLSPYDSWKNRIAVHRFVQDIPLSQSHPSYPVVHHVQENLHTLRDVPMLICWGEQDFVFDDTFLEEWRRRFPEAEVYTFPEAGHYVLEDAGPEILERVRHFLAKHPVTTKVADS